MNATEKQIFQDIKLKIKPHNLKKYTNVKYCYWDHKDFIREHVYDNSQTNKKFIIMKTDHFENEIKTMIDSI